MPRIILCVCLFVAATGCTTTPSWRLPSLPTLSLPTIPNPLAHFYNADDDARTVSSLDQLREISANVSRMDSLQQEGLAHELDARFPREANPLVRAEIARLLGRLQGSHAIRSLGRALQDESAEVRQAACDALGRQGGPAAIDKLAFALRDDENIDVRLAAARALGGFWDLAAREALAVAVNDGDPALQYRGVQSIRSSSQVDLGNRPSVWQRFLRKDEASDIETPEFLASESRSLY